MCGGCYRNPFGNYLETVLELVIELIKYEPVLWLL